MKNYKKNYNGFTLIELIAVMAIIAIMLAFALPSLFALNDESDKAMLDAETSAIYKVVSSKLIATTGRDVTQIFNLTENPDFFEMQNISDDEVFFCFSTSVQTADINTTITTFDNATVETLQAANPDRFIIIIPINDATTNTFDFTQDIVIIQPDSDVKYVNGLKDFS